ncbi:MAG: cysteine desulfurase [Acidobacteriota bacterium]
MTLESTAPSGAETSFSVEAVRAQFPALQQKVAGHPLAYLDSAASSQKPECVIERMADFYRHDYANVHRGVHELSQRATKLYEGARDTVKDFIGAARREEVIFTRGTTESLNLVAQTLGRQRLGEGDKVLITEMEHHSNIVPWQQICAATGAQLEVAPIDDRGQLLLEEFERRLDRHTRIVAISHVSNALGTINPIGDLIQRARRCGAFIVVDGAQAVPHLAVDVRDLDCDFYAFSSHKMYGPGSIGVLYGKQELLEDLPPWQGGGDMIRSVRFSGTEYAPLPYKFEAGTPNIVAAAGLAAAIEFLQELGLESVAAAEDRLLEYGEGLLSAIPEVRLIGTAECKAAVLSFIVEGVHPHDLGTILDQDGIAVRAGHHCAQPLMERFGVPATLRASLGVYNTTEELDRLAASLEKAVELFR